MARFVRLVVPRRHEDSRQKAGVFCVAYRLRDRGELPAAELALLERLLLWFARHLPVPTIREPRAVFWFRGQANACTRRIWELA